MARVSTCLNFPGSTEEAFAFYKTAFGTKYGICWMLNCASKP